MDRVNNTVPNGAPLAARTAPSAAAEWRNGWPLVVASMIGMGLCVMDLYTVGLLVGPLGHEFGWTRVEVSEGLTIVQVISLPGAYLVGLLIDKTGPRRIALPGIVIYCAAFALLATATGHLAQWWGLWILLGLAAQLVKPTVWAAAVAGRFAVRRGSALALTNVGVGIASTLNPVIVNSLIDHVGWRIALVSVAGLWALVALPLGLLFFYGVTDRPRETVPRLSIDSPILPGVGLMAALRDRRFWMLAVGAVGMSTVIIGITVHIVPILLDGGMRKSLAASIAGVIGLSSIAGRLLTGQLLDRFHGRIVGAVAFAFPCGACLLLLNYHGSVVHAAVAAFLIGTALGAEADLCSYLVSRYFGMRHFGALYGALISLLCISIGLGAPLAGLVFERTGSYDDYFLAGIPICLVASLLIWFLGPYSDLALEPSANVSRPPVRFV